MTLSKHISFIYFIFLFLLVPGCSTDTPHEVLIDFSSSPYALMTVELKDSDCATLTLTNCAKTDLMYDKSVQLNVKQNNIWYDIPCIKDSFEEVMYGVLPGAETGYELILSEWFGPLSAGDYRIIKPIYGFSTQEFVIAEFTIE